MATWFGFSAHGVQFFPEWPGPDQFENVNNIGWTDQSGLRRGWGVQFRGRDGKHNWFHCAIPTLGLYVHLGTVLQEIHVSFETFGNAVVDRIHVWGGRDRLYARDGLALSGDHIKNPFVDFVNLPVKGGLNVCVHANFGPNGSEILFSGAYVRYETQS